PDRGERNGVRVPLAGLVHRHRHGQRRGAPQGGGGAGRLVAREPRLVPARLPGRADGRDLRHARLASRRVTVAARPVMPRRELPLVVDRALDALAYRCWPDGCPRHRTCCVGLVVEASRREVRAIDSLMDELARLLPALRERDGFANVFVDDPPGYVIESRDDGSCPFLLRDRRHALCAIHSLALATGRPVASVKPAACRHWPLRLDVEGSRVCLTVQETARAMGCVTPRRELPGHPSVRQAFGAEIAELCRASGLVPARG